MSQSATEVNDKIAALVAEVGRLKAQRLLDNEDLARAYDMGIAEGERRATAAEMERLRAEVSYLRACVPPTRPTDYGHEVWTAALRAEVAAERAAVVTYLRGLADDYGVCIDLSLAEQADKIESGEHRREEEK